MSRTRAYLQWITLLALEIIMGLTAMIVCSWMLFPAH